MLSQLTEKSCRVHGYQVLWFRYNSDLWLSRPIQTFQDFYI